MTYELTPLGGSGSYFNLTSSGDLLLTESLTTDPSKPNTYVVSGFTSAILLYLKVMLVGCYKSYSQLMNTNFM